jgi:hypothetical protein
MSGLPIEDLGRDGWLEGLIFERMRQAYQISRLLEDPRIRRMGEWLLQRVNLSLPRLAGNGDERPASYWRTGWCATNASYDETVEQVLAVYDGFIRAAARSAFGDRPGADLVPGWQAREQVLT